MLSPAIRFPSLRFILINLLCILFLSACGESEDNSQSKNVEANALTNNTADEKNSSAEKQSTAPPQQNWQPHIQNHSTGWVSANGPLFIRFNHRVADEEELNQPLEGIVTIEPAVNIKTSFSSATELSIIPIENLSPGQTYTVSFHPQKFENLPDALNLFSFQVQALNQDYELRMNGLEPSSKKHHMHLTGSIKTTDVANEKDITQTLNIRHKNKQLAIDWVHSSDKTLHEFSIKNIPQEDKSSEITIKYDAEKIGVEKYGTRSIQIPARDEFKITGARVHEGRNKYIEVSFSEALTRSQNIQGLVRLNGQTASNQIDRNFLRIYPQGDMTGKVKIDIDSTIRSAKNKQLDEGYSTELVFTSKQPGIRFSQRASIIPPNEALTVPIEAINVNSVWITAYKIFEENIPNHLQSYPLSTGQKDDRTGRYLWRKKIVLPSVPFDKWERFDIDVSELMKTHSKSLMQLEVRINRSNIALHCENDSEETTQLKLENYNGPNMEAFVNRPAWFNEYYSENNGYYTYEYRKDPCDPEYYTYYNVKDVVDTRNFIVSNIGLIVKKGQGNELKVTTTNIKQGTALANVEVKLYNYQRQLLDSVTTDQQGFASLAPKHPGFYVVAQYEEDKNYLRLPINEALPTSQFDTQGEAVQKGIKGFIYGERDVWRPGDDIFLSFILEDKDQQIPSNHPVSLDFFDPRGTKVTTLTRTESIGGIYTFKLNTKETAPTGNWRAVVRVGGEYFDKTLKVETITPNRLKIDLTPAQSPILAHGENASTEIFSQWLNGATARELKADTEIKLRATKTSFEGFSQFLFDDPASGFRQYNKQVFSGKLNAEGKATFDLNIKDIQNAPGKLKATFVTRVFEQSGNFSTAIRSETVLPYEYWAGLYIPKGNGWNGAISREADHNIDVISIDSMGNPQGDRKLKLSIYKIDWRWWWDQSYEDLSNYVASSTNNRIAEAVITTDQHGKGSWQLEKNKYDWGRHLVRICDEKSGHCSGKEVYLGWSSSNQVNPDSATQLMLSSDKKRYKPGEKARITIPELAEGKILYSLENGSKIIKQEWLDLPKGATHFDLPITADMAPNAYLNVSLLLAHDKRTSDAPIRLYGITPLMVDDSEKRLEPVLDVPESTKPQSTFEIKVSETNNQEMYYTLAVVDEGLLGITGYKTPDPTGVFNKREALGVFTWDVYDSVLGAYGASLERLLKIGGGDNNKKEQHNKEQRFRPVVNFLGSFKLDANKSATHSVTLPQYMGEVRVMLVAANNGAYGKAEKSVKVTQALGVLATLPRVIGPKEKLSLPVNVFVNDPKIKTVTVKAVASDIFKTHKGEHTFNFDAPGDQIASLQLEVLNKIGKGEIRVVAEAGDEKTEDIIYIQSRAPNAPSTKTQSIVLNPGETWSASLPPHGIENTNHASLSIGSFPTINLEKRLGYLIRYPHGCLEQTTSAAFPQLKLGKLTDLSQNEAQDVQDNVSAAINKIRTFQKTDGGFSYWPGNSYVNDWASIYATHFLVEAKQQGYPVPNDVLNNALNYLNNSIQISDRSYSNSVSAYSLFVLAHAGKENVSEMNRLREILTKTRKNQNDQVARWRLASAYAKISQKDTSAELMNLDINSVDDGNYGHYTYGSSLRDKAILLFALRATDNEEDSWKMAEDMAKQLSKDRWYSTHSTAWALLSLADYAAQVVPDGGTKFSINENAGNPQNWQNLNTVKTLYRKDISPKVLNSDALSVRNDGDSPLHIEVANTGVPSQGQETASSNGLSLSVNYFDTQGKAIDVSKLRLGQDFVAELKVGATNSNTSWKIEDIAQSARMPSGWQIRNERLEGDAMQDGLDYQDIRDDAVNSYFSLWKNYRWYYRYNDNQRDSQTIRIKLNASFAGKFYLPGWQVKSMYDEEVFAQVTGQWVEVLAENK